MLDVSQAHEIWQARFRWVLAISNAVLKLRRNNSDHLTFEPLQLSNSEPESGPSIAVRLGFLMLHQCFTD